MSWNPTTIRRADKAFATATDTVRVTTDSGPGYLKALGNHGSPHYLAADLVGTRLAEWFALPTFEWAIIDVTPEDEIIFLDGKRAQPGPAFITQEHSGTTWSGKADIFTKLINPSDIGRLVLFDTWMRNCDRHPPDLTVRKVNRNNVFPSNEGLPDAQWRLIAMDHTHCFNCGRDLNAQLAHIDLIQDDRLFLFPEFISNIRTNPTGISEGLARLAELDREWLRQVVGEIPAAWQVGESGRTGLVTLIGNRADFVRERFSDILKAAIGPFEMML